MFQNHEQNYVWFKKKQTTLNEGYVWYGLGHHLKSGSWSKTRCEPLDDSTVKGAENKPRDKSSKNWLMQTNGQPGDKWRQQDLTDHLKHTSHYQTIPEIKTQTEQRDSFLNHI